MGLPPYLPFGGFHKWGIPKWLVYNGKHHYIKSIIWMYPISRNPYFNRIYNIYIYILYIYIYIYMFPTMLQRCHYEGPCEDE